MIFSDDVIQFGTAETSVNATLADVQRAADYLASLPDDDAQGLAADLAVAHELIEYLHACTH